MKLSLSVFLLAAFFSVEESSSSVDTVVFKESVSTEFFAWMEHHTKTYQTSEEAKFRLGIWNQNNAFIEAHNSQEPPPSYTLGHNHFSDLTLDEYQELHKLGHYSPGVLSVPSSLPSDGNNYDNESPSAVTATKLRRLKKGIPDSVDWVELGGVLPVKNQGVCGSCWAFSAIAALEGAHFLDTGKLVSLSEQQLIDCDKNDMGCGGGLMDNAFLFDENSTGICSELDYPYAKHRRWLRGCGSENGECVPVEHTRVKTFFDVENTVDSLMEAIFKQPVSVAVQANTQSFMFYKSGVFDDPSCGEDLDHGVAAVGYGTTDEGADYFKVRNSWGPTWGDEGYILMSRTSEQVNGTCGILSYASRPTLRDD
jgi:C1A family cysteine protease